LPVESAGARTVAVDVLASTMGGGVDGLLAIVHE
jgi:hypothetical protein